MPGVFRVTSFPEDDPNPKEFLYEQVANSTAPPLVDALAFRDEVEKANTKIKSILSQQDPAYFTKVDYRKYYTGLLGAAKTGLQPDHANLDIGNNSLQGVKDIFVMEKGVSIRAQYIGSISRVCGISAATALSLGISIHLYLSGIDSIEHTAELYRVMRLVESAMFILLGVSISMWISSMLKNQEVSWNSLAFFDPAQFPPILRLALVCALAFVLSVMLLVKWITLGVGPETLNDFPGRPLVSIIIGLVCGLAEDRVSKLVISRFTELPSNSRPGNNRP